MFTLFLADLRRLMLFKEVWMSKQKLSQYSHVLTL
jgi:hypothetical protein